MKLRLGLSITRTSLRVVAAQRNVVTWKHSTLRSRDKSLSAEIERLLADRPAALRGRIRLVAVVGAAESQLRQMAGLPDVRKTELDALIAQNVDRFFVQGNGRQRISTPETVGKGDPWAAAIPEEIVTQVATACRTASVICDGVIPVTAALARIVTHKTDVELLHDEDAIRLQLVYRDGFPRTVVRERTNDTGAVTASHALDLPASLDSADVAAFAATRVKRGDAFVIAVNTRNAVERARARVRMVAWSIIAAAGIVIAAWAPGAQSEIRATRARAQLAALSRREHELHSAERELAQTTQTINAINAFEASRRSTTVLLAELALALPDSTVITTFRVDSTAGALTVLTAHAPATLDAMSGIAGIARTQLAGSISREISAGHELERASIRFTLAPLHHTVLRAPHTIRTTAQR